MDSRFFFGSPSFDLSGVNTASANLVRELRRVGADARFLLTRPDRPDSTPMPPPDDIPFDTLPIAQEASWPARWKAMVVFLTENAPCVYVPGYDWEHSCVAPLLPPEVVVAGVVHSDDPAHYEHLERMGPCWDLVVCVSRFLTRRAARILPTALPRLWTIPSGVEVPPGKEISGQAGHPLRLVYTGRIIEHQKRVSDLARIAKELDRRGLPFVLTLAGDGPEREALERELAGLREKGAVEFTGALSNRETIRLLKKQDVFLLVSAFEGTPVSLLEAMAQGLVPVVTDIRSGIPELVLPGRTGFLVETGNVKGFCDHLEELFQNPDTLAGLSHNANQMLKNSRYNIENTAQWWIRAARRAFGDAEAGAYRRPRGKVLPPPSLAHVIHSPRQRAAALRFRLQGLVSGIGERGKS